ncbi:putative bifunctional diguanylate cyclase/phosphodiesterase [Blastococcus sp. VKM Ac-2987]|uniref:putative bifunctional diguanylate cyclase/phosphodiesterase n=1 Tax=Blastococcus sp. VKM Ac-2987 TaxID=3004141 RepID=UPI0022ABA9CA|nr:EAL domain-containing protein [Blastococcus sp. VKM Ac-2987]MCZ2857801.1 EAL domain-containing protein [Blastococcus sp. VKM Ac-2987]
MRRSAGSSGRDAALVEAVLDALASPTVLLDPAGRVVLANSAWTDAGKERGAPILPGADYHALALQLRDDADARRLVRELRELSRGERTEVSVDRSVPDPAGSATSWFHVQASRVDQAGHVVVTHLDITARVRAERASAWRARHDSLTELPNRAHLHELIDAELQHDRCPAVAVLFLDVDGFKDVNDSLGHEVGDELLRQLAGRLLDSTRAQDTVGRLGGDEFVVLCRDCDAGGAEMLAHRCQATFEQPFDLGGRTHRLSASIGIAAVPAGDRAGVRSTDLVRDADLAMYAAKAAGRNRVRVFSPDLRYRVQRKVQLAAELRGAISDDQLLLHYQPVIDLTTGLVTGAEALVRWRHSERGVLPPCDFVPVAEQHDLIIPLTRWVLGETCRQAASWRDAGAPVVAGVNVSAVHLATGTLVDDVVTALQGAGLDARQLVVELTETSAAEDPARAAQQFRRLRELGVESSIDDFGRGFSSLSQLVAIPAGVLKIDKSLVAGADDPGSQSAAVVAAVVGLAEACGMRSLAEGVETAAQLQRVAGLGCRYAQGFHIARPMPGDEFLRWFRSRPEQGPPAG